MPTDYNDDREVTEFLWRHHSRLMTEFEQRVGAAIQSRLKLGLLSSGRLRNKLELNAELDDATVNEALADGHDAFRDRIRDRLLDLYGDRALITRCPRCKRVLRTPAAKQCLWCGEDWHGSGS